MKKRFISMLIGVSIVLLSCVNYGDLGVPKTISVKNEGAYDIHVGKFTMSDYFSAENVLDAMDDQKDKAPEESTTKGSLKVYDYNPDGNSPYMQYIFCYTLEEIPLDFNKYFQDLNINENFSNSKDLSLALDFNNQPFPEKQTLPSKTHFEIIRMPELIQSATLENGKIKFSAKIPEGWTGLKITPKVSVTDEPVTEANTLKVEETAESAAKPCPAGYYFDKEYDLTGDIHGDFKISVTLEVEAEGLVNTPKGTSLKPDFSISFDIASMTLKNQNMTGNVDTGLNLSDMIGGVFDDENMKKEVEKLKLPENSVMTYLFVDNPIEKEDGTNKLTGTISLEYKKDETPSKEILADGDLASKRNISFTDGKTVTLSKEELKANSSSEPSPAFTNAINDRAKEIKVTYDMGFNETITLKKEDIAENTSIKIQAAIVLPFNFEIEAGKTVKFDFSNIFEKNDKDDSSERDDILPRDEDDDWSDKADKFNFIEKMSVKFDTKGISDTIPIKVKLSQEWPETDPSKKHSIESNLVLNDGPSEFSLTTADIQTILRYKPFAPDFVAIIGDENSTQKQNFSFPRNFTSDVRVYIKTNGEFEIYDKEDD